VLDVYKGTLGEYTPNLDKIKTELNELIIKIGEPLNYEVIENKYKVVLITGKHEIEKEVIPFHHPLIFKDVKDRDTIAIDLRMFMKQNLEDMINVTDYFADRYNGRLQLNRLILNKMFLEGDTGFMLSINEPINYLFSTVISTTIMTAVFDKQLGDIVNVLAQLHYVAMDIEREIDFDTIINMLPNLTLRRLITGDLRYLKDSLERAYKEERLILPSRTISDLVENIKVIYDNKRAKGITEDLVINGLSRSFIAVNSKELSIAMVEHKPTLLAIIYSVLTEGINNRSMIRKIADSRKSFYKTKEIIKTIENVIEDNLHKV